MRTGTFGSTTTIGPSGTATNPTYPVDVSTHSPREEGEGKFTSFQVEVENGYLEMFDLVVTFGNGDKESPKTRFMFNHLYSGTVDGAVKDLEVVEV